MLLFITAVWIFLPPSFFSDAVCIGEASKHGTHTYLWENWSGWDPAPVILAEINEEREQKKFLDLIALVHHIDAMRYGLGTAPATIVHTYMQRRTSPLSSIRTPGLFLSFVRHARKPTNDQMTNRSHSCTTSVGLLSLFFQVAIDFYDCLEILEWILERISIAKVSSWTKQKKWSKKSPVFFMWQGQRNL